MSCGQDGGRVSPSSSSAGVGPRILPRAGVLGRGPPREREASAGLNGAERAGWNRSVRGWGSGLRCPSPRATSERGTETRSLRGPQSHRGAARCVCLPQGGRGMVAELAAAELPGSQGEGKPGQRPFSGRAPSHFPAPCSEPVPLNLVGSGPRGPC